MSVSATDILNIARGWLGYSESNGKFKVIVDLYNSHKPLARGYALKYSDEWCDGFVSACAIKAGATDLIGTEVGVGKHVEIFKQKGIWLEDGTITPNPGDIIVYNWDKATQPNDGAPDHIGIVEIVKDGYITAIEGNKNEAVARRTMPLKWGCIRGFARPKYTATKPAPSKKSSEDIAKEVILGKWGNGTERLNALTAAGYNYGEVQEIVSRMLNKSVDTVAKEVIAGKWGSGLTRKRKLEAAGYNYTAVQRRVNELLG